MLCNCSCFILKPAQENVSCKILRIKHLCYSDGRDGARQSDMGFENHKLYRRDNLIIKTWFYYDFRENGN